MRSGVISRESAVVSSCRREVSCSDRFRAVTSRAITEAPTMLPPAAWIGETVSESTSIRPSLVTRSVS